MEKRALGRGLSALIPTKEYIEDKGSNLIDIAISEIKTNKYQPRYEFNQEKLNELISSIKEKGIVQPVLVRKSGAFYELIAGERRLRAAKSLGIEKIPAIIKDVADNDMLEISLIENIQREELNAMEEANAFNKFVTDFNYTQEKIARALGKDRSTVANIIRLLGLPKKVQDFISKGMLTTGHAKAILGLATEEDRLRVSNVVVKKGLSVRETEQLVARRGMTQKRQPLGKDAHITDIEARLQQMLGTRVKISHGKKRGVIQIEYYSPEDMDRLIGILAKNS